MDFEDKLEQAIQRGQNRSTAKTNARKKDELSKEAIRNRFNELRLNLSDHIEQGLKKIANHFPGFDYETIYGSKGWGGAISRNDLDRGPDGKAGSFFSRVEMTVRPQNEFDASISLAREQFATKRCLSGITLTVSLKPIRRRL